MNSETAAAAIPIPTPTPSTSSNPAKGDKPKPSIDIRKLALRISSAYHKLNTITHDKLISIEKNVDWKTYKGFNVSPPVHRILIPTLKFNKYEVEKASTQLDIKKYFDNPMFDALSPKEKENIYYMLLLRSGVRPLIAVLVMVMEELFNLGYQITGLINGETIQIDGIELRKVTFAPTEVNFLITKKGRRPLVTMIENFTCCDGVNKHYILCWGHDVGDGSVYVLDIGGLQYGHLGSRNELIGNWEPLSSYITRMSSAVDANIDVGLLGPFEISLIMGFRLPIDCQEATVKSVIKDLEAGKNCCDYCGHILDQVSMCSACEKGFYCGRDCQKSDWKAHKLSCVKKSKPQEVTQQIGDGTGEGLGPKLEDVAILSTGLNELEL